MDLYEHSSMSVHIVFSVIKLLQKESIHESVVSQTMGDISSDPSNKPLP
jgi:hypothetical protein